MKTEQITYFFDHLVDGAVTNNMTDLQGFVFILLPLALALFIILVVMRKVRGNKIGLNVCVVILYCVAIILPASLVIHSLIFLGQNNQIILAILLYLLFGLICTTVIQEFYPRFRYKTDVEFLKAFPLPDGRKTVDNYLYPSRLQIFNTLYALAILFMLSGFVIYVFSIKHSISQNIGGAILLAGAFYWWIFLVFLRRFVLCTVCHRNVYGNVKANKKTYVLGTIRRILQYHCFTCMYCFAHIKVGKRDIIKEKNLEIINMHQPDFEVRKKK